MRKGFLLSVLMMTLLPLSGCFGGGEAQDALDLALTIRGEYLAMTHCSAQAELTADYGQRVYDYGLALEVSEDETVLTLTSPELVAGVTARIRQNESFLEYDTVCVETGPLTSDGLTPISAIPALLEALKSGYITSCGVDDSGLLRVDCGDPDTSPGTGTEFALWLDPESHALIRGEVSVDGFRCINCIFSSFTKE